MPGELELERVAVGYTSDSPVSRDVSVVVRASRMLAITRVRRDRWRRHVQLPPEALDSYPPGLCLP